MKHEKLFANARKIASQTLVAHLLRHRSRATRHTSSLQITKVLFKIAVFNTRLSGIAPAKCTLLKLKRKYGGGKFNNMNNMDREAVIGNTLNVFIVWLEFNGFAAWNNAALEMLLGKLLSENLSFTSNKSGI